ncbi:AAA family ATPase [Pseudonocardia abyssalis]|uniref:AAA family ATPase n=1 Tax=Pseudonocardia abyssalis TaxID=2792008 RepID=A0ABS6UM07_9PSEU|nr:AAA family ATPase [Pseudonocardia abyssalis]MBW0118659.1 AAA family ATPase [Pseudonocardia abyssalis]MBW0133279.1 AAA family ATPase [Pseudonocardia abyssalis]
MTTRFRIDVVRLDTTQGDVTYRFPSPLTVLAGPVGVGKSTLFELIKFAVGGNAELTPVVDQYVRDVEVHLTVGQERYGLTRSLDSTKRNTIRVTDLITRERLPDRFVSREPMLSTLLLEALGLPTDMRAAARTRPTTNAGDRISFADIFTFMYVRQADINRDIASSQENYREPKRRSVFEVLFRITDAAILKTRSEIAEHNAELLKAENNYEVVLQFLRDSNTANRIDAENAHATAVEAEAAADTRLRELRESLAPVEDRATQTLRDLLSEAERTTNDARQTAVVLAQQQIDYTKERRRIVQELDRLGRLKDAGERLADFEFKVCPRCMQDVGRRHADTDLCRLCLQPDPLEAQVSPEGAASYSYEQRQLTEQLDELDDQVAASADRLVEVQRVVEHRQSLISQLTSDLSLRTRDRITPQLQVFNDVTQDLMEARARQLALEGVLRQWDRADDLGSASDRIRSEIERLRASLQRDEERLDDRKTEIFNELDAEFSATVAAMGVPGIEQARMDRNTYLPLLNGTPYKRVSPAGGIRTATQVAYWLTLMTVALRRRDTEYPAFLLIDSPRTSLNDDQLAAALYRRIVTRVAAAEDRLQIIMGDNELPSTYRRQYEQIDFTYDNPTIGTVAHPGPAVETLTPDEVEDVD